MPGAALLLSWLVAAGQAGCACDPPVTPDAGDAGSADDGSVDGGAAPPDASELDASSSPVCGNGVIEPGEECDGVVPADCLAFGHNAGFPRCIADCTIDVSTPPRSPLTRAARAPRWTTASSAVGS